MNLDTCTKIGNLLINEKIDDPGLMNGKAGISIFYYHLAKKTSNKKYLIHADRLIDEIYKQKWPITNFKDGIAGIGWCVEYLIQNSFCKGNANNILKGIDTIIFKYLNEHNEIPFNLQFGLIGYLQYILMRLKNKKDYKNDDTQINIELFKFIINQIDRLASYHLINLTKDIKFNLLEDIYILLLSLIDSLSLNIYNDKIINILKQWEIYFVSYIPGLHINRLYLSIVLSQINTFLKLERISNQINTLLYSIDCNTLEFEMDIKKINNIQFGYVGFLLVLNMGIKIFMATHPDLKKLLDFKYNITELYKNRLFALNQIVETKTTEKQDIITQNGLSCGWAGVGLILLLNPTILTI